MFWLRAHKDFIQPNEVEMKHKLQFMGEKDLSEGSCAYLEPLTDERIMIHWYDKEDSTKLDKTAVVDYVDLNTVIENYRGI